MTLSVIVPTKGRAKDLIQTIDSVCAQSRLPDEIIIVDQNLSEDVRKGVYTAFTERLNEINISLKYIHDPRITGLTQARNRGIEKNECDIVLFLDDDVILEKDFIRSMIEIYKKHPDIYGISGIITNCKIGFLGRIYFKIFSLGQMANRSALIETDPKYKDVEFVETSVVGGGLTSYRREVFNEFKFDENYVNYALGEDMDFSFRVSRKYKLAITHRARLIHNISGAGRSNRATYHKNRVCSMYYFFSKNLDKTVVDYLSFIWLITGYFTSAFYGLILNRDTEEIVGIFSGLKKIIRREESEFVKGYGKMECVICNNKQVKKIYYSDIADVYACPDCQGVFSTPKIATDEIYDEDYFAGYKEYCNAQTENSRRYIMLLRKYKNNGSILDYGCGSGIFLKTAGENGFVDNLGVDVSDAALKFSRENTGVKDRLINIKKENIGNLKFDIISFLDSIAHIDDVKRVVRELRDNNLKDGGIFFIRTPNINRAYLLYARMLSMLLPARYSRSLYFLPNRYILFNRNSIKKFLETLNMEILYFDLQRDYSVCFKTISVKAVLSDIIYKVIPSLLNPGNSMVVIAGVKP